MDKKVTKQEWMSRRSRALLLGSLVFCFTFDVSFMSEANATGGSNNVTSTPSYVINGTLRTRNGAIANFGNGKIGAKGKIINETTWARIFPDSVMQFGTGNAQSAKFVNNGTLVMYGGSQAKSDKGDEDQEATIENASGFVTDKENTARANQNVEETVDGYGDVEGYKFDLQDDATYEAGDQLPNSDPTVTTSRLAHAAYYDLVNDDSKGTETTEFEYLSNGRIVMSEGTTVPNQQGTGGGVYPEDFTEVTQNSQWEGGTKLLTNVTLENSSDDALESTLLDHAYYIGRPDVVTVDDQVVKVKSAADEEAKTELKINNPSYDADEKSGDGTRIQGSIHTTRGYIQYADKTEATELPAYDATYVPEEAKISEEDFNKTNKYKFALRSTAGEKNANEYYPVYEEPINEKIIISQGGDADNFDSYEEGLTKTMLNGGEVKELSENETVFTAWETGEPATLIRGDNSYYRGVFKLKRGGLIVDSTASMFGGRIELGDPEAVEGGMSSEKLMKAYNEYYAEKNSGNKISPDVQEAYNKAREVALQVKPTEMEWRGGAKDPYNQMHFAMNGMSTLFMKIPKTAVGGTGTFSVYGSIESTDTDRLIFEEGNVLIKGDWSGFRGQIGLCEGAHFEVSKSDEDSTSDYTGKFPNAIVYQLTNEGVPIQNLTEQTLINTANMENLTAKRGYLVLDNDTEVTNASDAGIALNNFNTERRTYTVLNKQAKLTNVVNRGVMEANADVSATNTTVEGGVLVLNANLDTVNVDYGSTLVTWGNNKYGDRVRVGGGEGSHFTITDTHSLKFFGDYDFTTPDTGHAGVYQSDRINAANTNLVFSGEGIEIGGMNFNGTPVIDEYKFIVYEGPNADSAMPINLGAKYTDGKTEFDVYSDSSFRTNPNGDGRDYEGSNVDLHYVYTVSKPENALTSADIDITDENIKFTKTIDFGNGNNYYVGTRNAGGGSPYGYVILKKALGSTPLHADEVQETLIINEPAEIGNTITDTDGLLDAGLDFILAPGEDPMQDPTGNPRDSGMSNFGNEDATNPEYSSIADGRSGYGEDSLVRDKSTLADGRSGYGEDSLVKNKSSIGDGRSGYGEDSLVKGKSTKDGNLGRDKADHNDNKLVKGAKDRRGMVDSKKKRPGKYRIWNKTFGEHAKRDLKGSSDVKSNSYGTILGFDGEPMLWQKFNTKFMPTVFAGLQRTHSKYLGTKYHTNSYFGGLKGALFNSKHALEVFGFYEFMRTKANITSGQVKMKSHVVSLGAKYGYNFELKNNWFLRPIVFFDYARITTPSFRTGTNTSKHKINNQHRFEIAPGLSLSKVSGLWTGRAFVSYHHKFGTKGKSTVNSKTSKIDFTKKNHVEYGIEINRTSASRMANIGLKLTRKDFGTKGFKATLSLGVKF